MFENFFKYMIGQNHSEKYVKIIKSLYNIQYIYCENCIRTNNLHSKMCLYKNKFKCIECNKSISIQNIRDDDFVFDNEELKDYLLKSDTYYKIKCLLIFWEKPNHIVFNTELINQIIIDIKQDNFDSLLKYDPNYLPV